MLKYESITVEQFKSPYALLIVYEISNWKLSSLMNQMNQAHKINITFFCSYSSRAKTLFSKWDFNQMRNENNIIHFPNTNALCLFIYNGNMSQRQWVYSQHKRSHRYDKAYNNIKLKNDDFMSERTTKP
jgi:hypothetical protein